VKMLTRTPLNLTRRMNGTMMIEAVGFRVYSCEFVCYSSSAVNTLHLCSYLDLSFCLTSVIQTGAERPCIPAGLPKTRNVTYKLSALQHTLTLTLPLS
jgi:hypothetical protein